MPTHTHDDRPTVRAETSPVICHLAYVHAHSQRQTHRPSRDISRYPSTYVCRNTHDPRITPEIPRDTPPPSAADGSPRTGVSSGMLNRPSPAIRITYSKRETAALADEWTQAKAKVDLLAQGIRNSNKPTREQRDELLHERAEGRRVGVDVPEESDLVGDQWVIGDDEFHRCILADDHRAKRGRV